MLQTNFISSLEKCFIDQKPENFRPLRRLRMYKNEKAAVQFLAYITDEARVFANTPEAPKGEIRPLTSLVSPEDTMFSRNIRHVLKVETEGDFAKFATIRRVEND